MGTVWRAGRYVERACSIALLAVFWTMGSTASGATWSDLAAGLQAQREFLALSSEGTSIDAELYRLVELAQAYSAGKMAAQEAQSEGSATYRSTSRRIDALRARIQQTPVPRTADPGIAERLTHLKTYLLEYCDILKQSQSNRFEFLRATLRGDSTAIERLDYRELLIAVAMLEGENRLISVQSIGSVNSEFPDPQSSLNEVVHASNRTLSQWFRAVAASYEEEDVDFRKLRLDPTATRLAIAEGYGNALEGRLILMSGVPGNEEEQELVSLITQALDSFEKSFETEAEVVNLFEELNLVLQQLAMGEIDTAQFQAKADMLIRRIEQMTSDRFERDLERIEIFETYVKLQ